MKLYNLSKRDFHASIKDPNGCSFLRPSVSHLHGYGFPE